MMDKLNASKENRVFSRTSEFRLLGAGLGNGAQISATRHAPGVFKQRGLSETLGIDWHSFLEDSEATFELGTPERMISVIDFNKRLSQNISDVLANNHKPIVIGGDHSVALGTWFGVSKHLRPSEKLGLIWIDAHLDSHTFSTSPSKAIHGMPVATLLGHGDSHFQEAFGGAVVNPEDLVFIGARSYEEGEHSLLKELGVKIFYMKDVDQEGFDSVFERALEHISKRTDFIGVSLDMDAFDPTEIPAVGSPEKNGIFTQSAIPSLSKISNLPNLIAFEIVELNPELDKGEQSFETTERLLAHMFNPPALDKIKTSTG